MKPLIQEANSFITAGNGTNIEGFREQDTLRRALKEREGTSASLRDGNKQPSDLPKKLDAKESDARWLCGNWPLRNRARETCFRLSENPPKAVETNDESNYEGPPTACRRNFTSGSHVRSWAKSYSFHYQTVMGLILITHQKLKGRFA